MLKRVPAPTKDYPFIAVNILPARVKGADNLATLMQQILEAKACGFKYVWVNPIAEIPRNSICTRICLDTGIHTDLYRSLYAPNNPLNIRADFPHDKVREMNKVAKESGIPVLVDFVWKHISEHSYLLSSHPKWKGKKIKDIIEYNFESTETEQIQINGQTKNITVFEAIILHLKEVIDLYLDPNEGLGFAGLRIDAASHFTPKVRKALLDYINEQYPHAIVFEEVLFDRAQEMAIKRLADDAVREHIYSNFTTSNLYYQISDDYGALPHPEKMGDSEKLKLSDNHGISFTGNHDHYSVGWSVVLTMAAKRLIDDQSFFKLINGVNISPLKNDKQSIDNLRGILNDIINKKVLVECLDTVRLGWLRFLLPYANEIAREIFTLEESVFNEFKTKLFERIADRTLASISGYFFLFSELNSPFENQRIFTNKEGEPLQQLLLTVEDLASQSNITMNIIGKMMLDKKYDNIKNFMKHPLAKLPIDSKLSNGKLPKTKSVNKSNLNKGNIDLSKNKDELRVWLPYIVEYLRNNPEDNGYAFYKEMKKIEELNARLCDKLGLKTFISSINEIYANYLTPHSADYHTFRSLDQYKIIVRCSDSCTDIAILNLNPDIMLQIDDIDILKIAVWFQARKYPINVACPSSTVDLKSPFDGFDKNIYAPDGYPGYWRDIVGSSFDDSFDQIVGNKADHQTNLYLGVGLKENLEKLKGINKIIHVKTERQQQNEDFHDKINEPFPMISGRIEESKSELSIAVFKK